MKLMFKNCLLLLVVLAGSALFFITAFTDNTNLTLNGKLINAMGIGGETTGWAIELSKPLKIDKTETNTIEVELPKDVDQGLVDKEVVAQGVLEWKSGVERGSYPIVKIKKIHAVSKDAGHSGG